MIKDRKFFYFAIVSNIHTSAKALAMEMSQSYHFQLWHKVLKTGAAGEDRIRYMFSSVRKLSVQSMLEKTVLYKIGQVVDGFICVDTESYNDVSIWMHQLDVGSNLMWDVLGPSEYQNTLTASAPLHAAWNVVNEVLLKSRFVMFEFSGSGQIFAHSIDTDLDLVSSLRATAPGIGDCIILKYDHE